MPVGIDASIARNADTEYLVDRPYEDKTRVRVTGPFTVESLSPHRVLPADEDDESLLETLVEMTGEESPRKRTRSLTRDALLATSPENGGPAAIEVWRQRNEIAVERALNVLADVKASGSYDTTTLPVALRELKSLVGDDDQS